MSWIERVVEERLSEAAAAGELAAPALEGRPIADLHWERPPGWWAERFVERELSHDRRKVAQGAAAVARAGFWRAADEAELGSMVAAANRSIERANADLVPADRLERFDPDDIVARWRRLPSG